MRSIYVFAFLLLMASVSFAQDRPTQPSVREILNPDGTLRLDHDGSYSLDGFELMLDAHGRPVATPKDDAQTQSGSGSWGTGFNVPNGLDDAVHALAVYGGELYVGGSFTTAGGISANRIARWNGSAWSAVGTGISGGSNPLVLALAVYGGELYVGGSFTTAGGTPANNIARWNGSAWSAVGTGISGGSNPSVRALAVYGGELYVGGNFTTAGGTPANNIARWNGSAWSAVGTGISGGSNPLVLALAVYGGELYVGGNFTTAGGTPANNIARWNGSAWSAVGTGISGGSNPLVLALAVYGGELYVGGNFTTAGGTPANNIARWNGSAWSAVGTGISGGSNPLVLALAVYGGELYVGGSFTTAGGTPANNIARWNGSAWNSVGLGTNDLINALAIYGTDLCVGGEFGIAGGSLSIFIARWNGSSWSSLGSGTGNGLSGAVRCFAVYNGELYVGGLFTTAGGISANRIARWNGSAWNTVGSGPNNGVNGAVLALTVYGGELYVGGSFTTAGGISANRIARWNGSAWNTVGTSPNDGVSGGSNPIISDFLIFGGRLYVGGSFTTAGGNSANNIAWWDSTTWSAVGSGPNNGVSGGSSPSVNALAVYGGDLYVGGSFTTAGGTPANNIAHWNGSAWSAVGTSPNDGVNGGIFALASYNGELYAGGLFTTAGGTPANSIARWNGSAWNAVGSGPNNGVGGLVPLVYTLSEHYGELYVGGIFSTAGGVPANNIARWNGSAWSAVGSGGGNGTGGGSLAGNVSCSVVYGDHLFFGGDFTLVNIGGSPVASSRIARWTMSSGADAGDAYTISGDGSHVFLTTGVRIVFLGVSGEGVCAVRRFDSPASNVSFSSPPANQSQYRFVITTSGFTASNAILRFNRTEIPNAGIGNAQTVVVYRRPNVGIGTFTALPNAFNSSFPNEVRATTNAFGEFVLGSNDLVNQLPVELAEFSARRSGEGVLLAWRTASELNNAGFEVQRKLANASDWLTLGFVKGNGTTSNPQSYSFLDKTAVGAVQYRLKQIDLDGRFEFSNIIELDAGLPKTFVLEQNYPNPFNPTTTIAYQLPVASEVTLKVYDALGKEVATLVNARQEAGAHQVVLNASALSSGAYFYRLRAGAFVQTRKMMLVK